MQESEEAKAKSDQAVGIAKAEAVKKTGIAEQQSLADVAEAKQKTAVKVRFHFFYHTQVHNVFSIGTEKYFGIKPFFQRIQGFQDQRLVAGKVYLGIVPNGLE